METSHRDGRCELINATSRRFAEARFDAIAERSGDTRDLIVLKIEEKNL